LNLFDEDSGKRGEQRKIQNTQREEKASGFYIINDGEGECLAENPRDSGPEAGCAIRGEKGTKVRTERDAPKRSLTEVT